jgi:uncharacterized protein (DUF4213/DUF364 family)
MPAKNTVPKTSYLNGAKILDAAKIIPDKKAKNGAGRAAEVSAKRLGTSASTMYQARAALKNASEKDLQDIRDGRASIKKIYNKSRPGKQISHLKNVVDVLERNNYKVIKIEEAINNPHAYSDTLNLQIVPKKLTE